MCSACRAATERQAPSSATSASARTGGACPAQRTDMTGSKPLKGLLVVSMEQAVAAPYCASRLADAGARVIKIERPEGDFARAYDATAKGQSSYFVWLNRGKESVCLDIKDPDDKALLARLIARAGVREALIERSLPGRGKGIAVSFFDGRADWMTVPLLHFGGRGKNPP